MPNDIAACRNKACGQRLSCARYRMVVGDRQTFAMFEPVWSSAMRLWSCADHVSVTPPPWPLHPESKCL